MLKNCMLTLLLIQLLAQFSKASIPEDIANSSDECLSNSLEASVLCRGSRAIRNVLNNLSKTNKPIVIVRGLEIVPSSPHQLMYNATAAITNTTANNNVTTDVTDNNVSGDTDDTFLGRFSRYLRTHELNIKFSDLMADESERRYLARDLEQSGMQMNHLDEARKKDKGGGMMMMMALMFSKMMAVMGLGGIGALAMKALGISMMALIMAGMVGMKSLAHQGHESTHSVQYVTADGHHHKRRRRSSNSNSISNHSNTYVASDLLPDNVKSALPLVYRGWRK